MPAGRGWELPARHLAMEVDTGEICSFAGQSLDLGELSSTPSCSATLLMSRKVSEPNSFHIVRPYDHSIVLRLLNVNHATGYHFVRIYYWSDWTV
jgi:hypothetical protein